MENKKHLAILSVPLQEWGEIYDEIQALKNGTVFQELNLPFFATVQDKALNRASLAAIPGSHDDMLLQIQQVSFVADDLRLYLDTHPDDKNGLKLLKEMLKRRKTLTEEFALKYYPLTVDCMEKIYEKNPESECYCWVEGPIPWEGVCR